jgi:hypothetical protein
MPDLASFNEIAELADGFPDCRLSNLPTTGTNDGASEAWLAFVREHGRIEPDRAVRDTHNESVDGSFSTEITAPLQTVPPGSWRSLGGYLDYSGWAARERFLELDKAIARAHDASAISTQLS